MYVMTVWEMEAKKVELVRTILDIDNEEVLNILSDTLRGLTDKMPCMYTVDEIQAGANVSSRHTKAEIVNNLFHLKN